MPVWTPHSLNPSQSWYPNSNDHGPGLLVFEVGSALYYVTNSAFTSSPADNIWIQKSTDGGVTWTGVYNGPKATDTFNAVLVGTVIYIFGDDFNGTTSAILTYRFDTATDTFLADGTPPGIVLTTSAIGLSVFSDGTILLSCGFSSHSFACATYDPAGNSWTGPVTIASSGNWSVTGQVTDTASDIAFIFTFASGSALVSCTTISRPLTVGTTVTAVALFAGGGVNTRFPFLTGAPVISAGRVVFPYIDPYVGAGQPRGVLYVTRATISTSPVFGSAETVDDTIGPDPGDPAQPTLWTLDGAEFYTGHAAVDVSGTLYLFYSWANNQHSNNTSQTTIYYRTSTAPGTWSAHSIVWTGPVPSESLSIYPRLLASGGIGIIEAWADPVVYLSGGAGVYSSLTVLFLAPAAPVSVACSINIRTRPLRSNPRVC